MESIFLDNILSREEWESRQRRRTRGTIQPKWQHKPADEKTPDHPFFSMNTCDMNGSIRTALAKLMTLIHDEKYANIVEISELSENVAQLMTGPAKLDWSFAIIGDNGEGKSTLTNSLLARHGLAAKSGGTKSCTQYATRYEHLPGAPDDATVSDVALQFYSHDARTKITQEHLKNVKLVHHPNKNTEENEAGDAEKIIVTEYDKRRSNEGIEFLRIPVRDNQAAMTHLDDLLESAESFNKGSLLEWSLQKQHECLEALGADATGAIKYLSIPDKTGSQQDPCEQTLLDIIEIANSLASLVDIVTISTGGILLRHGIVLLDVPGYGDRSQTREASANAHRRGVHGELVVAPAKRVEDRDSVDKHVLRSIHAHGNDNTILVMNQVDQLEDLDAENLGNLLDESSRRPFPEIQLALKEVQEQSESLLPYETYLTDSAQSAAKRQLMNGPAAALTERYNGQVTVVATCASDYHQWLDPYRFRDPKFGPYMSGIPHLRHMLFSMVADKNLSLYRTHYFEALPRIVDSVQRIRTKTVDKTGVLASCRAALEESFQEAIRASYAANGINIICIVPSIFSSNQKNSTTDRIRYSVQAWSDSTVVMFQTFNHTILNRGIPLNSTARAYKDRDVNWNRDILDTMERPKRQNDTSRSYPSLDRPILSWKDALITAVPEITHPILAPISDLCSSISSIINSWSVSLILKRRTDSSWKIVEKSIQDLISQFPGAIEAAITRVYRDITTEEDVGCMIAEMNEEVYDQAEQQQRGKGVYARQRQSLLRSLCFADANGKTFIERYEELAVKLMNNGLALASERFISAVEAKLNGFIRIIEQFVETDVYNTPEHADIRAALGDWLPEFKHQLLDCQHQFSAQQGNQDVQLLGSFERWEASDLEPPSKKIKVENEDDANLSLAIEKDVATISGSSRTEFDESRDESDDENESDDVETRKSGNEGTGDETSEEEETGDEYDGEEEEDDDDDANYDWDAWS